LRGSDRGAKCTPQNADWGKVIPRGCNPSGGRSYYGVHGTVREARLARLTQTLAVLAVSTSKNSRRLSWPIQASAVLRRWTLPNSAKLRAKAGGRPTRKAPLTNL